MVRFPTQAEFVATYAELFEHSPWVALRAWRHQPFENAAALHAACMAAVAAATPAEQLALINAHPELAARVALTDSSAAEQRSAGLKHLTPSEYETFRALNAAYREKFGFPFIICVAENTKTAILHSFRQRLANDPPTEHAAALAEIGKIAWSRLQALPA